MTGERMETNMAMELGSWIGLDGKAGLTPMKEGTERTLVGSVNQWLIHGGLCPHSLVPDIRAGGQKEPTVLGVCPRANSETEQPCVLGHGQLSTPYMCVNGDYSNTYLI